MSDECRLDMTAIARLVETSLEFANELVNLFVRDSWDRVEKLARAAETGDQPTLRRVARALKDSSTAMGARRLADFAPGWRFMQAPRIATCPRV